jgi:ABC-2 type transport system ATP-binding protein
VFALEIQNVTKNYHNFTALKDISFKLQAGDFVGLLGVNGAGKTSLISAIAGINNFNGQIKVMGYDVQTHVVAAKQNLGVVPQELAFDPFLTVKQTLEFQSGLYGVKNNQAWINEIIERMHLEDKVNTNTRALSGGMKRRLMVAQALVHKPPLIILDEPTVGVDVEIRKNLWDFITELHSAGHTILLTTHYLEEVEKLCNQIIMIDKGQIIAESSKDELISKANGLATMVEITTANGLFNPELAPLVVSQDQGQYNLRLDSSDQLADILQQLNAVGAKVENINIVKPKLEDIFLNYLGR